MRVEHLSWPEYERAIRSHIVVLTVGAIDAHGPHLPLATDTIVAQSLARDLARQVGVLELPAIPFGQRTDSVSGGGAFPGVTEIRGATLTAIVFEVLCASYRHGARRFLILDSHKANTGALREAVDQFVDTRDDVRVMAAAWWDLVAEESRDALAAETGVGRHEDHHAAMVETSLVMHLAPDLVRYDLVADDFPQRRARYLLRPTPRALATRTGVVHRAAPASADIGRRLWEEIVGNLLAAVRLELSDHPKAT